MDLHPIIVHFPVALLTIYSLLELARVPFLTRHHAFFYVKAAFLLIGAITLPLALATGDEAGDAFERGPMHDIVEAHEHFAQYATGVFALLAFGYALLLLTKESPAFSGSRVGKAVASVVGLWERWWFAMPLALLGFLLLLVTGLLGGVLAYGPGADPLAPYVLALLGLD